LRNIRRYIFWSRNYCLFCSKTHIINFKQERNYW